MGKFAPDTTLDQELDFIALSDYICACSGSPITFQQAYVDNMLAKSPISSGSFTKADAAGGGRQLTIAQKDDISITNSGTCLAVALVNVSASSLRLVTTASSQALVSGGTVSIPQWVFTIGDPT
jgi:hypothetical protein